MTNPKPSPSSQALAGVGALVGVLFGRYAGANLLFPVLGTTLVWFGLAKVAPSRKDVTPLAAILCGHIIWMGLGAAFQPSAIMQVFFDIVFFAALTAWLLVKPSRAALAAIVVLELLVAVVNVQAILAEEVGSQMHRALATHLLLRAVCVTLVSFGWRRLGARSAKPEVLAAPK